MTTPAEAAAELYLQLKPDAILEARDYVINHTPAYLQDAMNAVIEEDLASAVVPDGSAIVADGAQVSILQSNGNPLPAGSPGTASVSGGALASVRMATAQDWAFVQNNQPIEVRDSANVIAEGGGNIWVGDGVATRVMLLNEFPGGVVLGADQAIVTAFTTVPGELNTIPTPWACQFLVTNNVCDKIKFMPNATAVALVHGTSVPVKNAGVAIVGSPGTANITFSALNGIDLVGAPP